MPLRIYKLFLSIVCLKNSTLDDMISCKVEHFYPILCLMRSFNVPETFHVSCCHCFALVYLFLCTSVGTPEGVGPVRVGQKMISLMWNFMFRGAIGHFLEMQLAMSNGKLHLLGAFQLDLFLTIF